MSARDDHPKLAFHAEPIYDDFASDPFAAACAAALDEIDRLRVDLTAALPEGVTVEGAVAQWKAIREYDTSRCEELHGEFGRGWASCIHHLRREQPR